MPRFYPALGSPSHSGHFVAELRAPPSPLCPAPLFLAQRRISLRFCLIHSRGLQPAIAFGAAFVLRCHPERAQSATSDEGSLFAFAPFATHRSLCAPCHPGCSEELSLSPSSTPGLAKIGYPLISFFTSASYAGMGIAGPHPAPLRAEQCSPGERCALTPRLAAIRDVCAPEELGTDWRAAPFRSRCLSRELSMYRIASERSEESRFGLRTFPAAKRPPLGGAFSASSLPWGGIYLLQSAPPQPAPWYSFCELHHRTRIWLARDTQHPEIKMFPEEMIRPMRQELTTIGFSELRTPDDVDLALKNEKGTVLVVVNSVCGCAAGRPPRRCPRSRSFRAPRKARHRLRRTGPRSHRTRPHLFHRLSAIIAFRCPHAELKIFFMLERHQIEGRDPFSTAHDLAETFAVSALRPPPPPLSSAPVTHSATDPVTERYE